eukprot:9748745-Ditylum_brightwellii.AAC.2
MSRFFIRPPGRFRLSTTYFQVSLVNSAKSLTSLIPSFPNSSIISFVTSIYLKLVKKVVVCTLLRPGLVLAAASVMVLPCYCR